MQRIILLLTILISLGAQAEASADECVSGDCSNGRGTYVFTSGSKYVGEWRNDRKHGRGTYTWSDGRKYAGEFRDDKINGQGTFTGADGRKYVGEWRDEQKHGQGTFTWPDGNKYVGEFADGVRNGQGTFTWSDGDKYVGEYRDDVKNGQGILISASGEIKKSGRWENNELVEAFYIAPSRFGIAQTHALTIERIPAQARVRILNIDPKYRDAIALAPGKYHIEVSQPGYQTHKEWVTLGNADLRHSVRLEPVSTASAPPVAQTGGGSDADVDRDIPHGKAGGRYDIAVLVGNRNYERPGVPAVDYAHNDLDTLKQYLITAMGYAPENVLVEKDASKATFEMLFGSQGKPNGKLARFVRKGRSRVFVYYVGHGAPDPDTGEAYFVPVDSEVDYIASTGYPVSTFYANLRTLPAKELVVVLDSCFSGRTQNGLLFKNRSPAMLKVKEASSGLSQGAVFTSSRADQLSTWYPEKNHSLFTYYFLKGLQGAADKDKNQLITLSELNSYVSEEVEYWAGRLTGSTQQPKLEGKSDIVLVDRQ